MAVGRELSRHELLVEAAAAAENLREVTSLGDRRRFDDDRAFRYAVAFGWLRLTEPLCRLITRRLVADYELRTWVGQCDTRNMLAHDREQDIDFDALWVYLLPTLDRTDVQLELLLAER